MEREAAVREFSGKLAAWQEGGAVDLHAYRYHALAVPCLLRTKPGDPGTTESTMGATFPTGHARKAWTLLRRLYRSGGTYTAFSVRDSATVRFGHFSLSSVDADGTVRAGCHTIARTEIERFAASLGLPPVSADDENPTSDDPTA
jgi:hypothetical protein